MTAAAPAPPAEVVVSPPTTARPAPVAVILTLSGGISLALIAVFFVVYLFGFSALQEQRDQHQLYAGFRGVIAPASSVAPPIGGSIKPGTAVAVLNSSKVGWRDLVVVEGTTSGDLLAGPGHLSDTPLPGQVGQSILIGKSVTAGGPFGSLAKFQIGDPIEVATGQGFFDYRVTDLRRPGDPVPALNSGESLLTLISSTGSGLLGSLTAGHPLLVDAVLRGDAAAAPTSPSGRLLVPPSAVAKDELPGQADSGAWPYVVMWLECLLVAAVAIAWGWHRWGRWQSWLIGSPLLVGTLWGLSQEAVKLLPNTI